MGCYCFANNIIVDCQLNKVVVPIAPSDSSEVIKVINNAYVIRPERQVLSPHRSRAYRTRARFEESIMLNDGLLGDPHFAVLLREGVYNSTGAFPGNRILGFRDRPLTFADLFATHPEFVNRGIGLDPDAFKDVFADAWGMEE